MGVRVKKTKDHGVTCTRGLERARFCALEIKKPRGFDAKHTRGFENLG